MTQKPSQVSSIIVDGTTEIFKGPDGSLTLSDAFVPGIRLKDIIAGSVVVDPSILIQIEVSDWVVDPVTTMFALDIPHNWGLTGTELAQVSVVFYDISFNNIGMDYRVQTNYIYLLSAVAINCYAAIKRL